MWTAESMMDSGSESKIYEPVVMIMVIIYMIVGTADKQADLHLLQET